jgi:predicted transcriptional regulator
MLFLRRFAQHKHTMSSLMEKTEETNEVRDECAKRDISKQNIHSQIECSECS